MKDLLIYATYFDGAFVDKPPQRKMPTPRNVVMSDNCRERGRGEGGKLVINVQLTYICNTCVAKSSLKAAPNSYPNLPIKGRLTQSSVGKGQENGNGNVNRMGKKRFALALSEPKPLLNAIASARVSIFYSSLRGTTPRAQEPRPILRHHANLSD